MHRSPLLPRPRRSVGLLPVAFVIPLLATGAVSSADPVETAHAAPAHEIGGPGAGGALETVDAGVDDAPAPWVWPTGTREVVRPWEAPADDYAAGHRGVDVAAALGTTAVAVADGTVSFAGQVAGRGVVTIDHGDGLLSTLDSVEPSVARGDTVRQGTEVGVVAVGHCPASAPCLHLGARVDGRYVDPLPFLSPAAWPVLLPESAWTG